MIITILLFFLVIPSAYGQRNGKLYPICQDRIWGYINRTGEIVIEPQFFAANEFSEGLAAVRLGGTYGYIDSGGEFVLPAKYDLAEPFRNGLALVHIDGKPYMIDKKGTIQFEHPYKKIMPSFSNTY